MADPESNVENINTNAAQNAPNGIGVTPQPALAVSVSDFLAAIYPKLEQDEHILTAKAAGKGFRFLSVDKFMAEENRNTKKPTAAYFSTALARLTDGKLRNMNNAFAAMGCLVLDDIGTRIQPDKMDKELRKPNWIIESSPGNFQYGYILEEPIRDIEQAKALVSLVYSSGEWDSGGALANKLVRLPAGVNSKKKYRRDDGNYPRVKLVYWQPEPKWCPDDLLYFAGAEVSWEDIKTDAVRSVQNDPCRSQGATAYRKNVQFSMAGVVDEVLEWLGSRGHIASVGGEWWPIVCPWCAEHNNGEGVDPNSAEAWAYYSPIGQGEQPERRGFNCFHGACSSHKTKDFMEWVVVNGGPGLPIIDPLAKEVSRWATDGTQYIDMRNGHDKSARAFKELMAEDVRIPRQNAKGVTWLRISKYNLISKHPGLLRLAGRRYKPGGDNVITISGDRFINQCQIPFYSAGEANTEVVDRLLDFFRYLLPYNDGADFEWFMSHLAMKAQDATYRGNTLYMSTPVQGTGRGTMAKILGMLFGEGNIGAPSMEELVGGGNNANLRKLWLIVPEATTGAKNGYTLDHSKYERLKQLCDPHPALMTFEEKYIPKWTELAYFSVIICSNHSEGIQRDENDRRFKHFQNTVEKHNAGYFSNLHKFLDTTKWQVELWRWLLARDVSAFVAGEDAQATASEEEKATHHQSQGPMDNVVAFGLEYCELVCGGVVLLDELVEAVVKANYERTLGVEGQGGENWRGLVRSKARRLTMGFENRLQVTYNGERVRFRHTTMPKGVALMNQVKESKGVSTLVLSRHNQGSVEGMIAHILSRFVEFELG